jgi:predicted Zn finger-like uncharacterized protein
VPIPVSCPSCSAAFKVKDEYAGKRAKCPKCGNPLTIPSAFQAAETMLDPPSAPAQPVAARPVIASKPRPGPVSDEGGGPVRPKPKRGAEDEPESPRRKRGADSDDEGGPQSKRKRGGDAGDEPPRGKRRRGDDDDDEPKKKSKALPIILGVVSGLLLVCGGGCAGVYFGVIVPAAEKAKRFNDELEKEIARAKEQQNGGVGEGTATTAKADGGSRVTRENMNSLRAGMTLAQVEGVLGKGKAADEFDLLRGVNGTAADQQWKAEQQAGAVYSWGGLSDVILVAFTAPPTNGGTLLGVRGGFGVDTLEPIKLLGGGGGTPTIPTTPSTGPAPSNPVLAVTADALAREFDANPKAAETKYKGRDLKVTGVVADIPKEAVSFTMAGASPPATKAAIVVPVSVKFGAWGPIKRMKVGDTATVTGKIDSFAKGKTNAWEIKLTDCTIGK